MHRWALPLLLLTGCQSLENRLLYHPTPSDATANTSGLRLDARSAAQEVELRTADGTKVHARWCPHPQPRGVLIYCHGNAGNLDHLGGLVHQFRASLECSVLVFDYPGYGRSEGKPSEAGCYASAHAAYDWLTRVQRIGPEQIIICGESLGGGVAVELASQRQHQALVLIRTFTSAPDVAKQSAVLSSAPLIMVNRFDSLKRIPQCPAPVFIAQADHDRLMPFEHGEQLRDACKAPVRMIRLRGLDHNDPLPRYFFVELREFLTAVERGPTMH